MMCSPILESSNSDRIVYDAEDERLFYNPNWLIGCKSGDQLTPLNSTPSLAASDFVVTSVWVTSVGFYVEHRTSLEP